MFLFFVARRGKKGFQKGKGEGGRHEPLSPFEAKVSTKGTLKVPYDNYDFEAVYSEDIPEDEELIANDINCLQRTDSTKAGEMIEIQSFPSFLNRKDYSRAKKCRPSRIEQQNLNEKNARKKIIRLTNANFTTDDIWGTFGWDNEQQPPTVDDARRETVNFIGRINYRRKKRGQLPLKYLYVIESVPGNPDEGEPEIKYHIHIIMGGDIDRDETEKLWHEALKLLVSQGKAQYGSVPCKVEKSENPAITELQLLFANSTARELTDYEKTYQADRIKELLKELKKSGYEFKGRMREIVADMGLWKAKFPLLYLPYHRGKRQAHN